MRGLPFKVTLEEILGFFYGYGPLHRTDIIIEEMPTERGLEMHWSYFQMMRSLKKQNKD